MSSAIDSSQSEPSDSKSNSKTNVAKSGLWQASSFVVERGFQFVAQIVLARLLLPEDFGVWGMVLILTRLSEQFRDKATASVLIYSGLEDKKLVNAVYSLTANISIGMFFLQSLLGYPLAQFFGVSQVWPLTVCTATVFLVGAGTGSHGAILQRRMQFQELAMAEGLASIARFTTAIIGAFLGWGVWSFALGEVAMIIVESICKRSFSKYPFKYHLVPDKESVKQVRGYISKLVSCNLAVYANTNSDNFLIGKLLGASTLGFYGLAYQLAMLPTFALSKVNRVTFSVLSQRDNVGKRRFLVQNLELYGLCYAPVYGTGLILAPWLLPSLYGKEWEPAVILFQIILGFAYARGIMAILGITLNALNKPGVNAFINWVMVFASIPAFWVGAKLNGAVGVATSALLVLGVGSPFVFWIAICYAAEWKMRVLARPILFPAVALLLSLAITLRKTGLDIQQPFLSAIIFLAVYVVIITVFSMGKAPKMVISILTKVVK